MASPKRLGSEPIIDAVSRGRDGRDVIGLGAIPTYASRAWSRPPPGPQAAALWAFARDWSARARLSCPAP